MDQWVTRVRYQRRTGITDQGDTLSLLQATDDSFSLLSFIVLVQGKQWCIYTQVLQQTAAVAGILGRDSIHRCQNLPGPLSDIVSITDRCGDDIKRPFFNLAHCPASI